MLSLHSVDDSAESIAPLFAFSVTLLDEGLQTANLRSERFGRPTEPARGWILGVFIKECPDPSPVRNAERFVQDLGKRFR